MAPQTHDDGFHEIQLNGKQLVFLFMAATVVSVVIFLCGVFVGRGVRVDRSSAVADAAASLPASELTPQPPSATPTPAPVGSDPTAAAPPPAVDDLTYPNRLEKNAESAKDAKDAPAPERLKAPAAKEPVAAPAAKAQAPPQQSTPAAASSDAGARPWAVQVAAVNERSAADAIARRLSSKGYAAYVVPPTDGTSVFRVRVGKFGSQREAEPLKNKLEKEEQFKPWITR